MERTIAIDELLILFYLCQFPMRFYCSFVNAIDCGCWACVLGRFACRRPRSAHICLALTSAFNELCMCARERKWIISFVGRKKKYIRIRTKEYFIASKRATANEKKYFLRLQRARKNVRLNIFRIKITMNKSRMAINTLESDGRPCRSSPATSNLYNTVTHAHTHTHKEPEKNPRNSPFACMQSGPPSSGKMFIRK